MGSLDASTRITREARPTDVDELVRINLTAFRAGNAPALSPEAAAQLTLDAARGQWREFLDDRPEGTTVTVAEVGRRVCGFAGAGPIRDEDLDASAGELYSLYVDPELWGQGHGMALHDAALHELARGGFASATLWVLEGNNRARRFYRARGWEPDGAERPFMGANSLRLARVLKVEAPRGSAKGA
ncbi:MAG: N-acetyltransferase [Pseudonocardiales bacterium]|nr:MAG: N-acetyltransferase [Pseudonocardiales bacterium]